jgi:hypothetical protein
MLRFIEAINNTVKLITSIATLGILGAVVFFGLKAYHTIAELTSKPIQLPTVELPTIKLPEKIELPEVKVKMPDLGVSKGLNNLERKIASAVKDFTTPDSQKVVGEWEFMTKEAVGPSWDFLPDE